MEVPSRIPANATGCSQSRKEFWDTYTQNIPFTCRNILYVNINFYQGINADNI